MYYESVKEAVLLQLDSAGQDPDLTELFDFLVSLGVGKNKFIDCLLQYAGTRVRSAKRQLRFQAFGVANKMPLEAPYSKTCL